MSFIDKKKKKEETKVPVRDLKEKGVDEEKKDKPKAHAPSHTKIRSIGKGGELFGSFSNSVSCLSLCLSLPPSAFVVSLTNFAPPWAWLA